MSAPRMTIAWDGGTAVAGDQSPARHIHRYNGRVYAGGVPPAPTPSSDHTGEAPASQEQAGEFSVVVIDGLSAYVGAVPIEAACHAEGGLGDLHRLFTADWQWTEAVESKLQLNVDWVPNLIYFERLLLYPGTFLSGREQTLADALTLRFGTGCTAACIGLETFDLGASYSDTVRGDHASNRLYTFERNLGWRKVAWMNYWVKDTQSRGI